MPRATRNYIVVYDYWPKGTELHGKSKRLLCAHKEDSSGRLQVIVEAKNKKGPSRHVALLSYRSLIDALRVGVLRGDALSDANKLVELIGTTSGAVAENVWKREILNEKPIEHAHRSGYESPNCGACKESNEQIQSGSIGGTGSPERPLHPGSVSGDEGRREQADMAEGMGAPQAEGGPDCPGPVPLDKRGADREEPTEDVVGSGKEAGPDIEGRADGPSKVLASAFMHVFDSPKGEG